VGGGDRLLSSNEHFELGELKQREGECARSNGGTGVRSESGVGIFAHQDGTGVLFQSLGAAAGAIGHDLVAPIVRATIEASSHAPAPV